MANKRQDDSLPQTICGAKTKSGGICTRPPAKGRTRCRNHGGASPRGVDHPRFKHGMHSKAVAELGERVEAAVDDPALLDMRRPIAVTDWVAGNLKQRLDERDTFELRKRLASLVHRLSGELSDASKEARDTVSEIISVLEDGIAEDYDLMKLLEVAEKLSKQQANFWKVALDGRRAMSIEELAAFLTAVGKHLGDQIGDHDAARLAMELADQELTGGKLGLGRRVDL